jgi:putative transposase
VQLRYNFRIYPTPGQRQSLAQAFGCARVVYNDALNLRRTAHQNNQPYPRSTDLMKQLITVAKQTPQRAWLTNAPVGVLQQAIRDLDAAYKNFFESLSGKRKGPKVGAPRFRSRKDNRQAIRYTKSDAFRVLPNGRLRLPKVGEVEVRWSRRLPADPSSVTVILDAAGRYHVSFVVVVDGDETLPPVDAEIGVDLGLTHFAVTSSGRKIAAPKFLRNAERRLKRLQQALSRKTKDSSNWDKARVKVARAHAHVADTRRDWHHKLSTTLIRENQAVYVEDLAVNGLGRTRLAKSVHDAGWAQFVTMLEYKAARYGRTFGKVDRWFPSTRLCSTCGVVGDKKSLHVRAWTCGCGTTHDRDINAAKNVLAEGRSESQNARRAQVRPASVPAPRRETGTHRRPAHAGQ